MVLVPLGLIAVLSVMMVVYVRRQAEREVGLPPARDVALRIGTLVAIVAPFSALLWAWPGLANTLYLLALTGSVIWMVFQVLRARRMGDALHRLTAAPTRHVAVFGLFWLGMGLMKAYESARWGDALDRTEAVFFVLAGVYFISFARNRIALTEGGIVQNVFGLRWEQIQSWRWLSADGPVLAIVVRRGLPGFSESRIPIRPEDREVVDSVLRDRAGPPQVAPA